MNLKINTLDTFSKEVKRLSKKYKQLGDDLRTLQAILLAEPKAGIEIMPNCYKLRLANSSTKTGKSGGFRVIYYYIAEDGQIYLMSLYAKTEHGTISDSVLVHLINEAENANTGS